MKRGPLIELPTSDLPHLGFRCFLPDSRLRPWVQCYWLAYRQGLAESSQESMYPDGGSTLSFDLLDESVQDACFSASHRLHKKTFSGTVRSFGIRFQPGGAAGLFKLPLGEIEAVGVGAQDLGISRSRLLAEQLASCEHFSELVETAESWLLNYASSKDPKPGAIQYVSSQLHRPYYGDVGLLADLPFSRRTLERLFKQEVGLSPARLNLLNRVKQARLLIKTQPNLPLTDVALRCDFYDQAHFIRRFRSVTELSPGQYRQRQLNKLEQGMLRPA